jgi:hypothetical protein
MGTVEKLKSRIREEFQDIPFPYHCGIQAALAMDDWVTDTNELQKITAERDVKGYWWEIPIKEFKYISLASCYFDYKNTEFYLPAFMTIVLNNLTYGDCNTLVSWLQPGENEPECNFYDHFIKNFSSITGEKKQVCIEVLKHIRANLPAEDWHLDKDLDVLFNSKYWAKEC